MTEEFSPCYHLHWFMRLWVANFIVDPHGDMAPET